MAANSLSALLVRTALRGAELDAYDVARWGNLPLRARLSDRLTEALFAIDEAIGICEIEQVAPKDARAFDDSLKSLYRAIDACLRRVAD